MGLESATYISELVPTNPVGASDPKSQGDDHIRMIKAALQATFPVADKPFYFPNVLAKTAAYTILAADDNKLITGDATSAAFTLTLPTLTSTQDGWQVLVQKIDSSVNAVTVGGTINGATNFTLERQWEMVRFIWTGTAWVANQIDNPLPFKVTTKTADATLAATEMKGLVLVTPGAATVTLTLPAASKGDWVYIKNLHASNDVVIDPPGAVTIDGAATFTLDDQYEAVLLMSDGTNWFVASYWAGSQLVIPSDAPGGLYSGLTATNNTATPNTKVDVAANVITVVTTGGVTYRKTSFSVTIDCGTTGANGLDTGALANNTFYYWWAIYNPTTNTWAGLASTSSTNPTMPSGYTAKARFGSFQTNGSAQIYRYIQRGRRIQWVVGTNPTLARVIASGAAGTYDNTSPTLTAVSIAGFAPPTAVAITLAVVHRYQNNTFRSVLVAPNVNWGGTNNGFLGTNGQTFPYGGTSEVGSKSFDMLLEGTTIAWCSDGAGGAVFALGYEDNL